MSVLSGCSGNSTESVKSFQWNKCVLSSGSYGGIHFCIQTVQNKCGLQHLGVI